MNKEFLPNWNARKIREAAVPLKGKPLRNVDNYVRALMAKDRIPDTAFGYAFFEAIFRTGISRNTPDPVA